MIRKLLICIFALGMVVLSGCGGDDEPDSGTSASQPSAGEAADDDGSSGDAVDGGQGADVGDFPIPAPPDGLVAVTNDADGIKVLSVTLGVDSFDSAISFYDEWTASQPDEYQRGEGDSGGVSWTRTSGADNEIRIISLLAPLEGDEIFLITLTDGVTG
ncbi:MAG: hypothetical protein OEU32_14155 [Acidimicrobiia bacterium]|nr:hypothetical protein [Acidimicrobiia bacterium]